MNRAYCKINAHENVSLCQWCCQSCDGWCCCMQNVTQWGWLALYQTSVCTYVHTCVTTVASDTAVCVWGRCETTVLSMASSVWCGYLDVKGLPYTFLRTAYIRTDIRTDIHKKRNFLMCGTFVCEWSCDLFDFNCLITC